MILYGLDNYMSVRLFAFLPLSRFVFSVDKICFTNILDEFGLNIFHLDQNNQQYLLYKYLDELGIVKLNTKALNIFHQCMGFGFTKGNNSLKTG